MYSDLNRDPNLLTFAHMGRMGSPIDSSDPFNGVIPPPGITQSAPMIRTDVGPLGSANLAMSMGMRLSPPPTQDLSNIDVSSTLSSGSSSSSSSTSSKFGAAGTDKQRKGKGMKLSNILYKLTGLNENLFIHCTSHRTGNDQSDQVLTS